MPKNHDDLTNEAIRLLSELVRTPSLSHEENLTAEILENWFRQNGISSKRKGNNVWAVNERFDSSKPTILLNSHHDTVQPNASWTMDPFDPVIRGGKLFGLGSNDAGGSLVSLMATFFHFYRLSGLGYNLILAASAEEEISGKNGLEFILSDLPKIDFAIVGEPTLLDLAVAEKGLLVLDCIVRGVAGHAARDEGDNAIYHALKDIEWLRGFSFPKVSPMLGKVRTSVTMISAGMQHNVVPDKCLFTIDVRVTDEYTLEEIVAILRENLKAEITPRSIRLRPSNIAMDHAIVREGLALGRKAYGSPTTSDQAVIPAPSLKMGPGDSARSHMADEFIFIDEIQAGISQYIQMLQAVILPSG